MGQLSKVHFHFAGSELVDWVMANLSIEDRGSKLSLFMNTLQKEMNSKDWLRKLHVVKARNNNNNIA